MSSIPKPGVNTAAPEIESAADVSAFDAAEFDALLDAAVDGIVISDARGTILRVNQATEDLFGYTEAELVGQRIDMIMTRPDARAHGRYIRNYLNTGKRRIIGIGREVDAKRKDGTVFPVSLSIGEARVHDRLHFVGLIRDLTVQKRAEEEALRQRALMNHASRLTTMGEMAAALAHELNQPLAAISNYTSAGKRLLDQDSAVAQDDLRKALQEIGMQAHRAGEIIQRIRDFARSRTGEHELVAVDEMITEILPLARMDTKANHVDFRILVEDDLPSIMADRIQIQQVLLNLIRNGVDSMQDLAETGRRLDLRAWLDEKQVRISITDRGCGVSAAAAAHLFTPFFTTKESGMGMGLAICRSIIAAHGGTLDFFNNPVAGATFFVALPVSEP
ncbi:MAG: PAS domain S-box protein [Gammaproteobacteria bacterium]|nr:PAS domain S-box protein [Gammaproteobacteria bacterium]